MNLYKKLFYIDNLIIKTVIKEMFSKILFFFSLQCTVGVAWHSAEIGLSVSVLMF